MYKPGDIVRFHNAYVGIIEDVLTSDSSPKIAYEIRWCKNVYQHRQTEIVMADPGLVPATAAELRERMGQLKSKYDSRADDLLTRLDERI